MQKTLVNSSTNVWVNCIELPDNWSGASGEWQLPSGHKFVDGNGSPTYVWNGSVFTNPHALSADELTAVNWAELRTTRDGLLAACDWTVSTDTPLSDENKAKWVTYRAALRDLPANTDDPLDVTWPDAP